MLHIPRSVIKTSREEISDRHLQIHEFTNRNGETQLIPLDRLPEDLSGYVFTAGALFQSEDRPEEDGTQLYTGDGMVYRLGFENGRAILKTRIAKTPCYYADLPVQLYLAANAPVPQAQFARNHRIFSFFSGFRNGGQARYSIVLGVRNQLNTALLKTRDRLLVTIDAGRPTEIDPDSMELIAPVGTTKDWLGIFPVISKLLQNTIFEVYINPAHPVIDVTHQTPGQNEFFTANYSTGYNGELAKPLNRVLDIVSKFLKRDYLGRFTYLIRYNFGDENNGIKPTMERWRLMLPDGNPVLVEQSLHQVAITEKYIILGDISFRMEFSQIFSPFIWGWLKLRKWQYFPAIAAWVNKVFLRQMKPLPYSNMYIVKREHLANGTKTLTPHIDREITAKKIVIPLEVSHFAADYANPDDEITLHIGHMNGWDVTEWITPFDRSVEGRPPLRTDLVGMMTGPSDLGGFGRYVVDGETGNIKRTKVIRDTESTWSTGVYTHRDLCRDSETESATAVKNIYWMCWGFTWELIPERIYEVYKHDGHRTIALEDLPDKNKPITLVRLNTETMEIADTYQFPSGTFACSPQFIPSSSECPPDIDPSIHGYIVCMMLLDSGENGEPKDEFWVFHADDFNGKPIYRLSSPKSEGPLNLAFALHTTWLPDLHERPSTVAERRNRREQSVKEDYEDYFEKPLVCEQTKNLVRNIVYPHYIDQTLEDDFETWLETNP
jgi:carotenoid cleavage dioxygenase-like enzyme